MSEINQSDANSPCELYRAANSIEAAMLLSVLADQEIVGTCTGSYTEGFVTETPGEVKVFVRQSDLLKAQQVLREHATPSSIDWSEVDVGDPET